MPSNATTDAKLPANGLFTALRKLDRMIAETINAGQSDPGADSRPNPFRGLHIGPEDVDRWLRREPGRPYPSGNSSPGLNPLPDLADDWPRLAWLGQSFGLFDFDLGIVLIALAPEVDLRYEGLYAYLHDDVSRRRPSVDLALNLLCATPEEKLARRAHFALEAPLVWHELLTLVPEPSRPNSPLLAHTLRLDSRIVDVLLGLDGLDQRLAPFCRHVVPLESLEDLPLDPPLKQNLSKLADGALAAAKPLHLYFKGPRGIGRRRAAEALANRLGARLLCVGS